MFRDDGVEDKSFESLDYIFTPVYRSIRREFYSIFTKESEKRYDNLSNKFEEKGKVRMSIERGKVIFIYC